MGLLMCPRVSDLRTQPANIRSGGRGSTWVFEVTSNVSHWWRFNLLIRQTMNVCSSCNWRFDNEGLLDGGVIVGRGRDRLSSPQTIEVTWSTDSDHDVICQLWTRPICSLSSACVREPVTGYSHSFQFIVSLISVLHVI